MILSKCLMRLEGRCTTRNKKWGKLMDSHCNLINLYEKKTWRVTLYAFHSRISCWNKSKRTCNTSQERNVQYWTQARGQCLCDLCKIIPRSAVKEWPGQLSTLWTWQSTYEPKGILHPSGSVVYPFEAGNMLKTTQLSGNAIPHKYKRRLHPRSSMNDQVPLKP